MIAPLDDIHAELNRVPEVDYLMLADHAEVVNGKVYAMGAGWDTIGATGFPHQLPVGIVVGFRIPWSHANRRQDIVIEIRRDESQDEPLMRMEAQLETGRPAGRNGKDALVPMALNGMVTIPVAGDYVLTASIGDQIRRQVITANQAR